MKKLFVFLAMLVSLSAFADGQPSVARPYPLCDTWQWIGNGNTTWGCLMYPRQVWVADGARTDQVVMSLQEQIDKLKEQVRRLEVNAK